MPQSPPMTITELAAFRKQLKADEQVLKEKRAKVEAFQGLPPVRLFLRQLHRRGLTRAFHRTLTLPGMRCKKHDSNRWTSSNYASDYSDGWRMASNEPCWSDRLRPCLTRLCSTRISRSEPNINRSRT